MMCSDTYATFFYTNLKKKINESLEILFCYCDIVARVIFRKLRIDDVRVINSTHKITNDKKALRLRWQIKPSLASLKLIHN